MTDIRSAASSAGGGLRPAFAASRARMGLVVVLLILAGAAWWWTVGQMRGMDNGPWTGLGTFGWFLGIWVVMMAAMMFPSVAPTIALYSRMSTKSRLKPLVFTAGYLVTWAGAGVVAFVIGDGSEPHDRRRAVVGERGASHRRSNTDRGGRLRADSSQERLPGQVPQPARHPARVLARRMVRRASHGGEEWCVVRRVLLGTDGVTLRVGRHERDLDGRRRGAHRTSRRSFPGAGRRPMARRSSSLHWACSCSSRRARYPVSPFPGTTPCP